jgi:hypothetical protein
MKGIGAGIFALAVLIVTGCLAFGVHSDQLFL